MASYITYTQGATITYNDQTYNHSLNLQFTNYKMDKYGRKVDGGNSDLKVRSYYKVDGVDTGVNGMPLTVEDLVTLLTVKRANILEREITPMAKIIDARNKRIEDLGTLLASVAQTQSKLESQEEGDDNSFPCQGLCYYMKQYFTDSELGEANLLGWCNAHNSINDSCSSKKSDRSTPSTTTRSPIFPAWTISSPNATKPTRSPRTCSASSPMAVPPSSTI